MSVNPWYIPGSLQNLASQGGKPSGFTFAFRSAGLRTLLFVTHSMTVILDRRPIGIKAIKVGFRGSTVRASDLPTTDWVTREGDRVDIAVEFPSGLTRGRHHLRLEAVFGGTYGGGRSGQSVVLCEFEAEAA